MADISGYGASPYGGGPYGGAAVLEEGFDLFCFYHCITMLNILSDPNVSTDGPGSHFVSDAGTCDLIIGSGDTYPTSDARLNVITSVPQRFTLEWTARFDDLPVDFNNLVNEHVFVGTTSASGPCAGLFISKLGVMYAGGVHHTSGGDMVLDSTTQQIPGSFAYIKLGVYITFRMSVDLGSNNVYLFITETVDIATLGHTLRAVLPVIPSSALSFPPTDRTLVTVRGTVTKPSVLSLDRLCLSSSVLIPNLLPIADAGLDQAVRTCTIAQLDGSASFDPEGASLTYQWRLIDAPLGSEFAVELKDGRTIAIDASGYTDKFHSSDLALVHASDPIDEGDVLLLDGTPRTIVTTGVDGSGFYLLFANQDIPDSETGLPFKVLRQRGISGATTVNPTFFPDIAGFYSFDLMVGDGALSSETSTVILNVLESPLPRGCTPNLTFMFSYLSDFWNLVEDREPISEFWGALAQVAATELFTLWQIEYSKSLRDVQRQFIRRWIHYDPLLPEPIPEITTVRTLWGGVESGYILSTGAAGVQGSTLVISSPIFDSDFSYTFAGVEPLNVDAIVAELLTALQAKDERFTIEKISSYNQVAATGSYAVATAGSYTDGQTFTIDDGVNPPITYEIDTVPDGVAPGNVAVDISALLSWQLIYAEVRAAIYGQYVAGNSTIYTNPLLITSPVDFNNVATGELGNIPIETTGGLPGTITGMTGGEGGDFFRIDAPFPFTISEDSTFPSDILTPGDTNVHPSDTSGGAGVGSNTYKVSRSLQGLDIQENDFFIIRGDALRISRVVDDPLDEFPYQRVVVKETLPTAPSTAWDITGYARSEFLDFYNGLVDRGDPIYFESVETTGLNAETFASNEILKSTVIGVNEALPGQVAFDVSPIGADISRPEVMAVRLAKVVRRTYVPVDPLVQDIPTLTEKIVLKTTDDEMSVLRRNLDFFIEPVRNGQGIRFVTDVTQETPDVWEGEDPPDRLWAEYTYLDNRPTIEGNFGIPVEFTLDQAEELPVEVDYLSAVRGLWYAFLNGPTIRNLRIGVQILLGLPFAEQAGTIEEIRTDFSPNEGRILIRDAANPEIVRSYTFPRDLGIETNPETGDDYAVGDTVDQFAPLIEGAEVVDYVKNPTWFEGILNQGIFFEIEKFFRFLVRVDSEAFSITALMFVRNFILKIKPTYTYPIFLVRKTIEDTEVDVTDDVVCRGRLILTDTPCDGWLGSTTIWDDPRAGGGGWRNDYDGDPTPGDTEALFPTAESPILWAYDKAYLCPDDPLSCIGCVTLAVPSTVTFDSVLKFGTPVSTNYSFLDTSPFTIPAGPTGLSLTPTGATTAAFTGTIDEARVIIEGPPGTDPPDYEVILTVASVDQTPISVTSVHPNTEVVATSLGISVTAGDSLSCRIQPASGGPMTPPWVSLRVSFKQLDVAVWKFGDTLPAGRYCKETQL